MSKPTHLAIEELEHRVEELERRVGADVSAGEVEAGRVQAALQRAHRLEQILALLLGSPHVDRELRHRLLAELELEADPERTASIAKAAGEARREDEERAARLAAIEASGGSPAAVLRAMGDPELAAELEHQAQPEQPASAEPSPAE